MSNEKLNGHDFAPDANAIAETAPIVPGDPAARMSLSRKFLTERAGLHSGRIAEIDRQIEALRQEQQRHIGGISLIQSFLALLDKAEQEGAAAQAAALAAVADTEDDAGVELEPV